MKKILVLLAVAGVSSVAFAQNKSYNTGYENTTGDKYEVVTNKFWDNWFMSAGAGAEFLIGNQDTRGSVKDRISPTFNVAVGKWFTPGIGLRLQYSGMEARGFTRDATNPYIKGPVKQPRSADAYKQKFHYGNLHGDVLFNVSAMIAGYNPDRVYEFIPYLGAGFVHNYSSPKREAFAVNAGIINRFRLSSALDLNLELSAMGTENKFDAETGGKKDFDGVLAATVGLTYKFPTREFKKPQATRQLISEAELSEIRAKANALAAENANLKNELASKPNAEVIEREVQIVPAMAPRSVFFTLGSANLSKQEEMNLGFFVDQLNEWPENTKFKVTGYADSATGSKDLNKKLSEKRAQAVVDALVNTYKVDRNMFVVEGAGGVDKLIPPYLNRMVLIEPVK